MASGTPTLGGDPYDNHSPHLPFFLRGSSPLLRLYDLLVKRARDKKLVHGRKLKVDTTVVEADIHHPRQTSDY